MSCSASTRTPSAGGAGEQPEPGGTQADLGRRLLAGGVQDTAGAVRRPGQTGGGLEQQRGLANPRFATNEDERAGHVP